jgi:hypothetical protein
MTARISRAGQSSLIDELCKKNLKKHLQPLFVINAKALWQVALMPEFMPRRK